MMVRNWGASSIAADKIAAAHKMAFEILGLFNFFFILFSFKISELNNKQIVPFYKEIP